MWRHHYDPMGGLALSALVAALPIFVLLLLIGVLRKPAWIASLSGLAAAALVAAGVYGMPPGLLVGAIGYGAAFGLFPIGWIVFWAIVLYRLTVETGRFEILKDSVGSLTSDRRLQALLIAFAFGAFIEGAAGFGTPVAVAAAMLTGLGFSPFYAAGICLLANTAPVAFGSIGIPVVTLAAITGLPLSSISAGVGRICAPISLFVPAYLILVMGGWRALRGVLPAAVACGLSFGVAQFVVSNFIGPQLTDILSSLAAMGSVILVLRLWKPRDEFHLEGEHTAHTPTRHAGRDVFLAWAPYLLLVVCVLLWGMVPVKAVLNKGTLEFGWPGLHNLIERSIPVVARPSPYAAMFRLELFAASGTSCMVASILSAIVLGVSPSKFTRVILMTARQLTLSMVTIASVLALAFLMNYCGATATLGLAFAATGVLFPFFSALLGWLGVFLTGSDTSANALFGNLQVVTATRLNLNPVLMASANSAGGVMGKMISLTSIAVAAAATGMRASDESKLFRFTLRHSVLLAAIIGLLVVGYAYVFPQFAP
jgi:lactate permease